MGRGKVVRREGGEVIRGGSGGWFGLDPGDEMAGGEVAGDDDGDMIAAIFVILFGKRRKFRRWYVLEQTG
jgi:hypothetical protein